MTESASEGREQLWGDGEGDGMHPALATISDSLRQDMPLLDADLRGSAAYARALGRCEVLSEEDAETLASELETMREDFRSGDWSPADAEDVHTAIEMEVTRRLPDLGGRLHTGRSRNDQVATAFRLTVIDKIEHLMKALVGVMERLHHRADLEIDTLMPAYTHLQRAQPVRLSHWLMGFFWPLERDLERLMQLRDRTSVLPLGSGAVAGHPFGIDRNFLAEELGFGAISENSLDAVGDRDFALEFVFNCSLICMHLSRLSEELIIWSSSEFGYIKWRGDLATGSSLMPNKKNPDLVELVRGRSAQTIGEVVSMLTLLKGIPSSYQRDLQEDKQPVWRSAYVAQSNLVAIAAALEGIEFNAERMAEALTDDTLATEMADILVERGMPFRDCYRIVSKIAAEARERECTLTEVAQNVDPEFIAPLTREDIEGLTAEQAVERRKAPGGTARSAVANQLKEAEEVLGFYREKLEE
ncbi:MAG: argininosuccinate lyase [Myxococcota bacterium]|nr:argininosuccinate lyase [Myxococcota bacterium]